MAVLFAVDAHDLARCYPLQALRIRYALHRWVEVRGEELTDTLACKDVDVWDVARGLVDCGCDPALFPAMPSDGRKRPVPPQQLCERLRDMWAAHRWPSRAWRLEVVANLDADSGGALLVLVDHMADDDGGYCMVDGRRAWAEFTREKLQMLRTSVQVVQKVVSQVAQSPTTVLLEWEEADLIGELARRRHISPAADQDRVGLEVRLTSDDRFIYATPMSWLRQKGEESQDMAFKTNWHVAEAAAFVVDFCRGIEDARIGQCPYCERFWAERADDLDEKRGKPPKRCPRCRPLTLRYRDHVLHERGGEYYYRSGGEDVFVEADFDLEAYRERYKYVKASLQKAKTTHRNDPTDLRIVRREPRNST